MWCGISIFTVFYFRSTQSAELVARIVFILEVVYGHQSIFQITELL